MPLAEARLPIDDISILRGYGVFDFLRTVNKKPFHLKDHYERLVNSARVLDLELPIDLENLKKVLKELIEKNDYQNAGIRMVLTGGQLVNGINFSKPNFFILTEEWKPLSDELFHQGAKLITCDYCRVLPEAKNTNYLLAVKKQKEKNEQQALEILYLDQVNILEASTSNFFAIINNELITPKENILFGVTRKIIIQLAKDILSVRENCLPFEEIKNASECFITATNKDIVPIVKINEQIIGTGVPGFTTKLLMEKYKKYIENYKG